MENQNDKYKKSGLEGEVRLLFQDANNSRFTRGFTQALQKSCVRNLIQESDGDVEFIELHQNKDEDCGCGCKEDETCELCTEELPDICSMDECARSMVDASPFDSVASLLTTVKKYEFIALAENAYAITGNRPFKLKAGKDVEITEGEQEEIATFLRDYIQTFLDNNQVKINEIGEAFDLSGLAEATELLGKEIQDETQRRIDKTLRDSEDVIEKIFDRTSFMQEYLEVIKDTTDYPIGVLWIDDDKITRVRTNKNGKLGYKRVIQCDVSRIDPSYFWTTSDWRLSKQGRAVFRLAQFSRGDIIRWRDMDTAGSSKLNSNITQYLEDNEDGYRLREAMLFEDHFLLTKGQYDVLICRGQFDKELLKDLDVDIPKMFKDDTYIPVECYYSGGVILRAKVLEYVEDDLGVYTTVFRRMGDNIWGYSLHDFTYPFAKFYQASIKSLDKAVGKSVTSFIQIDTGVMEDPEKYMKRENGEVVLDLSEDQLIEFDSSKAYASPNFKGIPLHLTNFPSNIGEIVPVIDIALRQLDVITGIPQMLVNSENIASALRTNSTYNAAYTASSKVVKVIFRESERRILEPSIRHIFDYMATEGHLEGELLEVEPEILLSDTLVREMNDDNMLVEGLQVMMGLGGQMIPPEKVAKLLNTVGRKVYNLDEDLIPDVGVMGTSNSSEPQQQV